LAHAFAFNAQLRRTGVFSDAKNIEIKNKTTCYSIVFYLHFSLWLSDFQTVRHCQKDNKHFIAAAQKHKTSTSLAIGLLFVLFNNFVHSVVN